MTLRKGPDHVVEIGATGLKSPPLGWGMWRFQGEDVKAARARVDAALDIGVTLFDTADIYGFTGSTGFGDAEALFGRVLKEDPALRGRIILASKGGITPPRPYDSSATYLIEACENSLKRLQTETIDLYQIHRPDLLAHPAEVARALDQLKRQGKIRSAGVSNHTAAQTAALIAHLPFKLASIQPEFSPLAIDTLSDGVLDQAMQHQFEVLAWSPLAQGRLGGEGGDERSKRVIAALDAIASRDGVSRTAVAYAWVIAHPARPIALIGTQTPERIREAADAYKVNLTRDDWYQVLVASRGAPMP
jgi:predicted oxidoreductase